MYQVTGRFMKEKDFPDLHYAIQHAHQLAKVVGEVKVLQDRKESFLFHVPLCSGKVEMLNLRKETQFNG